MSFNRNATQSQLDDFRSRREQLNAKMKTNGDKLLAAQAAYDKGDGSATAVADLMKQRQDLGAQLGDLAGAQKSLVGEYGDLAAAGGLGALGGFDPTASISEQFQDPGFQEQMRRLSSSSADMPNMHIASIPREAIARVAGGSLQATSTGGIVTPTAGMGAGPYQGITLTPTPPTVLLDLIPTNTYDHATLPFSQEITNYTDAGPAPAAPGTTKPPAGIGYADATTASTTVAGYIKVNKQSLADMGQLQQAISTRLLIKLRQKLEALVLTADGTVTDAAGVTGIKGLLETTGIHSVDGTGKGLPEAILGGIAAVIASGGQPNAIVLNLTDWQTLLATKASGSGEYISSPFLAQVRSMWDVNFLPSVAVTQGTAVVLDTRQAATLLFREGASVIVGQESDDMIKNMVTLLCETRVLLPVWVPAAVSEVVNLGVSGS